MWVPFRFPPELWDMWTSTLLPCFSLHRSFGSDGVARFTLEASGKFGMSELVLFGTSAA